jgi:hypothetical protein
VEKGLTKLTEEESIFLANVIRQIYPDVAYEVRTSLSNLLIPKYGLPNVGRFEDVLADPNRSTESLYNYMTTQLGMENLTILELQVWRDMLKRKPPVIEIPATVEVKPKPEDITQPVELNLTPEQKTLVNEFSEDVNEKMLETDLSNVDTIEEAQNWFNNTLKNATPEEKTKYLQELNEFQKTKLFRELNNTLEKSFNIAQDIAKTNGREAAEKIVEDGSKKIPEKQRTWFITTIRKALNNPANAKMILRANIFFSVCQVLYTAVQMKNDPNYKLFGKFGGLSVIISKSIIFGFFAWTGGFLYTLVNFSLFALEGITALWSQMKNDLKEPDPNERSLVDKMTDKFYISITDAINYAEAEPPKEEFKTLQDSDELTYTLFDENDKEITHTDLKKTGSYVVVYVNGEAMVSLYKVGPVAIKAK